MVNPKVDIDHYEHEIRARLSRQETVQTILDWLNDEGVKIARRSLETCLKDWQISPRPRRILDIPGIELLLRELTYIKLLKDKDIVRVLKNVSGHIVSVRTIKRTRLRFGILKRNLLEQRRILSEEWKTIIKDQYRSAGLENYGRRLIYTHFKQNHPEIRLGERSLYEIVREIDPAGPERRLKQLSRRRGAYIVPGPNYIWSVDGHCKLERWGFEIYGAIDAYSRYITIAHCGYTARTGFAVMALYLDVLRQNGIRPKVIRSDKGVETLMLANLHHALARVDSPELPFSDCYFYGTSTSNQRIEAWWGQWTRAKGHYWGDYFKKLEDHRLWVADSTIDQVSLLAVFMPIIRSELGRFVDLWNNHKIRKQAKRPWVVAGQPWLNYRHPQRSEYSPGLDFGREVDKIQLGELQGHVDQGPG